MIEIRRYPRTGGMTVIASCCTRDVIRALAGCNRAVMTAGAASRDLGMIHRHRRLPGGDRMAGLASAAARDMRQRFAAGDTSVVAARAVVGDTPVIEICRHPGTRGVAGLAVRIARNMVAALAGGGGTVMTARAGTADRGMIEDHPGETAGLVTAVAFGHGLDVIRSDTRSNASVVATAATAGDRIMIHPHIGLPDIALMAIAAGRSAGDMTRRSGRSLQQRALFMASGTISWRALEQATDMTTLAGQIAMVCFQREARAIVIEVIGGGPGNSRHATPGQQDSHQQGAEVPRAALRSCIHASVSTLHPRR